MNVATALLAQLTAIVGPEHCQPMPPGPHDVPATAARFLRVSPRSPAEVGEVIAACAAHKVAVHPAGSGMRPVELARDVPRVFISTRRLNQIVALDESSLLVHAQAGVTGVELQKILTPHGLSLGDYAPSVLASTLGGILAVRTPGKSSARHGFLEDAVVALSAVLPDGRTIHTRVAPRRATGPDLVRALCGSEGTVGFITSAVLRVHKVPQARFLTAYLLPSVAAAVNAVYLALREEAAPSGIRIYDTNDTLAHFRGLPIIDELAAYNQPLPSEARPSRRGALLVVGTAGLTDLAACDRDLVGSAVIAEGGCLVDPAPAEAWWRRLHRGESTPAPPPTLQVMATPARLWSVYAAIESAMAASGATTRVQISRFDADGAMLFVSVLRDGEVVAAPNPAQNAQPHDAALCALANRAAAEAGGWLPGARAERLDAYLASLRSAMDPNHIMNPGTLG